MPTPQLARRRVIAALLGLAFITALSAPGAAQPAPACVPREQCCKVCRKGVACGDTCISASKTCHVGRGCACNDDEICD